MGLNKVYSKCKVSIVATEKKTILEGVRSRKSIIKFVNYRFSRSFLVHFFFFFGFHRRKKVPDNSSQL